MQSIDPLLLAPTCLWLAAKVEEYGLQSQTKLLTACTHVCEFLIIHCLFNITESVQTICSLVYVFFLRFFYSPKFMLFSERTCLLQ